MAEGAQVEREARIVAPAFIGRDACVGQQCLVTRGSNIERNSVVDYGTVIENTSVLPNTYVGIGLDVCHSVVDGNKLLNIQRDVLLEIDDSAVIRENKPLGEAGYRWWMELMPSELTLSAADEMAN
jgi:NDP-sugar pyrophosphorylase family protein